MNLKLSLFVTLVIGTLLVLANPLPQQGQQGSSQGTVAAPTQEQKAVCHDKCIMKLLLNSITNLGACEKQCLAEKTAAKG